MAEDKKKSMEVKNRYITIAHAIDGSPSESDFELKETLLILTVKERSNEVIVKNLYLSIDPGQLNRMKSNSSSQTIEKYTSRVGKYTSHVAPGQVINGNGVGRVVASASPQFEKGDLVVGMLGWEEYSVVQGTNMLRKLDSTELPLSHHVSILGTSGHAAYCGFYNICKPQKGEKVFVSAACGSVGIFVGQFAKLCGCYVVGCAGSKQKVDILKEKLGFDDAFNYKEETDLGSALKRYFPDGIDIYFDNVGGEMLDAAVANMNPFGRVAVCGVISEYTDTGRRASPSMLDVVYKRITIQGFLSLDHMDGYPDFVSKMSDFLCRGQIYVLEDISKGIENIPYAFIGLFRGDNIGKKIIKLEEE